MTTLPIFFYYFVSFLCIGGWKGFVFMWFLLLPITCQPNYVLVHWTLFHVTLTKQCQFKQTTAALHFLVHFEIEESEKKQDCRPIRMASETCFEWSIIWSNMVRWTIEKICRVYLTKMSNRSSNLLFKSRRKSVERVKIHDKRVSALNVTLLLMFKVPP